MAPLARAAIIFLASGILASPAFSVKSNKKWSEVTPTGSTPLEIKGNKSSSQYYFLDKKSPVSIKVVGPGSLRVYTRTELAADSKEAIYGLTVVRDGKKNYLISRTAKQSTVHVAGKDTKLGELKSVTFKVPKGTHEYQLTLPQDSPKGVYARFAFAEKPTAKLAAEKLKYVPFLPRKFVEEVRIVSKEEEYIYYRIDKSSKVELEIIGPAKLKIVSRLEFDHTMLSEKSYRLQISNGNEIVQTEPLKGKISATATYRKQSELALGRGDASHLTVPEGKHRYTVSTPDKNSSILVRFYLPEKALGNEWNPTDANGKVELKSLKKTILRG